MFFKTIEPGSWDKLLSQGIANILPFRKSGSISESDRRVFFQKTAASERFLYELDSLKLADGDLPVHVNAIGASEYYGPNRKGDAFSEQTCRDRHATFVADGRNYVHHRNRDPHYSFGKIASSCYNDKMHRIELLVVSNGSEAAAKRNGGLVLPDEFLTQLEKNAAVPVSMGCTILHDVCRVCGNKARTRSEYCDETSCRDPKTGEFFPGCQNGLMKIASDGRLQYVDNIEPRFFDLSYVGVPADRTGYGFRADYLNAPPDKTASWPKESPESLLGLPPRTVWPGRYRAEMKEMLTKLAATEKQYRADVWDRSLAFGLYAVPQRPELGVKLAAMLPCTKPAALALLARNGIILSPENFSEAFALGKSAALGIRRCSKSLFSDLLDRTEQTVPCDNLSILASFDDDSYRKLAEVRLPMSLIVPHILTREKLASSVMSGTLKYAGPVQTISVTLSPRSRKLAEAYALYQASALCRFPEMQKEFGLKLAVWQMSEPD